MAWASKKQYAILMGSEEGKDLAEKLPDLNQEEFNEEFADFLSKSGGSSFDNDTSKEKAESGNKNENNTKQAKNSYEQKDKEFLDKLSKSYMFTDDDIDYSFDYLYRNPEAKEKFLKQVDIFHDSIYLDDVTDDIRFLIDMGTGNNANLNFQGEEVARAYMQIFGDAFLKNRNQTKDEKKSQNKKENENKYELREDGLYYDEYGMPKRTEEQEYLTSRENLSNLHDIYEGDTDSMIEDLRQKDTGLSNSDLQSLVEAFSYKEGEFEPKDNSNYKKVESAWDQDLRLYEERMAEQEKAKKQAKSKKPTEPKKEPQQDNAKVEKQQKLTKMLDSFGLTLDDLKDLLK